MKSFGRSRQMGDLGLGSIPRERHCSRALIAKPEALVEKLTGFSGKGLQVWTGSEAEKLSLMKIKELLGAFGIRALGKHGAPLRDLLITYADRLEDEVMAGIHARD